MNAFADRWGELAWTFISCLRCLQQVVRLDLPAPPKECYVFICDWRRTWAPSRWISFQLYDLTLQKVNNTLSYGHDNSKSFFFSSYIQQKKQLAHCKYLTGCLRYQGLMLKERMIKMQARVQTSHMNFGKNILAQRRHCILNVLLPFNIITHCYKKIHTISQKEIALLHKCSMSGIYLSRQWAVNVMLRHAFSD